VQASAKIRADITAATQASKTPSIRSNYMHCHNSTENL